MLKDALKTGNCAISFVIAPPGKKSGAIMKLISGRHIGQKWSYTINVTKFL